MEDDLIFEKCKKTLIFFETGRQPQFFFKLEDDLNILLNLTTSIDSNGRQSRKKIIQPKTIKIKTMVVAPLRVT